MPYLSGVLTGIVLTVLVLFLIDQYGSDPGSQTVVNWGVLTQKLAMVTDQVREEVHQATAPDYEKSATPNQRH